MDEYLTGDEAVIESHIGELKITFKALDDKIKELESLKEKILFEHLEKFPNDILDL